MKKFKLKKEGEGKDCSSLDKKQAWSMLQLGWKKSHTETKTRFLDDRSWKFKHFNLLPKNWRKKAETVETVPVERS